MAVPWLAEKVEESEIRGAMLQLVKDGLEALPQDSWFTHSFDQRACNSHRKKRLAKARLTKVKKVFLKKD